MCRPSDSLVFVSLIAVALAACQPAAEEAVDVTIIGNDQPVAADPSAGPLSAPSAELLANTAQGLVRFDARGQIEPGLAERWNVSDDGLSYIFRLQSGDWPDGRSIHARDVARILNRQLRDASLNPLKDAFGVVSEIVAMTDRVIEVRLSAPRPNLLQLLAQPELAIVREGQGTGPFRLDSTQDAPGAIAMTRRVRIIDDKDRIEHAHMRSAQARDAVLHFRDGKASLVLGGSFVDLPLVPRHRGRLRDALRFDPVAGLFGLAPARRRGPLADKQVRDVLNRTIDRDGLIAALNVPNLFARTTTLQRGLEGGASPRPPAWSGQPFPERHAAAVRDGRQAIGDSPLTIALALPEGPGSDIIFARLSADWRPLGITLVRAGKGVPADLRLVDQVAPSSSPAWFVRSFRCTLAPLCSKDADALMDSARGSRDAAQRAAMLAEAGRLIDEDVLFMPLAAPIRWSLVGDGLPGFAENIFARHPLSGMRDRPARERQ